MVKTFMGIEIGSTLIQAVLIDEAHTVVAQGSHAWESELVNGFWTYPLMSCGLCPQDAVSQNVSRSAIRGRRRLGSSGHEARIPALRPQGIF
jgi:sugar (pentulose or hexulose) kinase